MDVVFRTRHGGEETFWTCVEWAPEAGRAKYVRVTPGRRMGHVLVECRTAAPGRTRVTVTYALTALSDSGRAALTGMTGETIRETIAGWRTRIEGCVAR